MFHDHTTSENYDQITSKELDSRIFRLLPSPPGLVVGRGILLELPKIDLLLKPVHHVSIQFRADQAEHIHLVNLSGCSTSHFRQYKPTNNYCNSTSTGETKAVSASYMRSLKR